MASLSTHLVVLLALCFLLCIAVSSQTLSLRLVHRFSEEAKAVRVSRNGNVSDLSNWPKHHSFQYYKRLYEIDAQRQKVNFGNQYNLVFPSEGSATINLGNDFGWLHYTWIDVGTPKVPFLVALDTGSDLLWVPCECTQCATLSAEHYPALDRNMNEYNPSASTTSKHLPCSHQLCELASSCKSPRDPCMYAVKYFTENTSTSGLLVEDVLHLSSGGGNAPNNSMQAPVILGCGMKQSGEYLDGVAPDGLMGLGLKDYSVPSYLAKRGIVPNSFSLCFSEDNSGRIYFGDKGPTTQQSTSFLPLDGKMKTYIVRVEACCIHNSCIKQASFKVLMDSGSSFTYVPTAIYRQITEEFDKQVNATRASFEDSPWDYCYKPSSKELPKIPSLTFVFPLNSSLVVRQPIMVIYGKKGVAGFCLTIQKVDNDIGIIGQNFMRGYRLVFDKENLKLAWSESKCQDLSDSHAPKSASPSPSPTDEQQKAPSGNAVTPAIAGRTSSDSSATSPLIYPSQSLHLLPLLLLPLHGLVLDLKLDTGTV